MNIDHPASAQVPHLRRLWKRAFGDEDAFLDLFFTRAFSPDRCRCITENGDILAALYWFDTACDRQKFAYLYAVATDPDHRNRGLCRTLMEDARSLLTAQGYQGLLLVPQTDTLAAMYRRMGYLDCTTVTEFTAPAEDFPLSLRRLNAAEYAEARRKLLPPGGIVQEGENLRFLDTQALFFVGNSWIAAITMEGRKLRCHELLGDPEAAYGIVSVLGCEEGFFRIPGPDRPFAQYMPLTPDCVRPSYFGLAFD